MTPQSIAIALAATLLTGGIGGWMFRARAIQRDWAFAVSVAIGLSLLRVSRLEDLTANLVPTSALGWLPWVCLLVAGVKSISHQRIRVASAAVLAVAIPLRLLWGSVYLAEGNLSSSVLIVGIIWAAILAAAIMIDQPAPRQRVGAAVLGWALLVGACVVAVGATGSITYAVATGVVGTAVVAGLLTASRLPLQGAVVLICLLGLSVAFSELPLFWGVLLAGSTLAVTYGSQEKVMSVKASRSLCFASQAASVATAAVISMSLASSDKSTGYDAQSGPSIRGADVVSPTAAPVVSPSSDAENTAAMPDPFMGFEP